MAFSILPAQLHKSRDSTTGLERKNVAEILDAMVVVRRAEDAVRAVEVADDVEASHKISSHVLTPANNRQGSISEVKILHRHE